MLKEVSHRAYGLKDHIQSLFSIDLPDHLHITGIAIDTRVLAPYDVFCAYPGYAQDGRSYVHEACQKGASLVLCEKLGASEFASQLSALSVPVCYVPNLASKIGLLATRYYGDPSTKLSVIGVTGTNGKTTTTQLISSALEKLKKRCGVVGTLGVGFGGVTAGTGMTTPDPITLNKKLQDMVFSEAQFAAIEVSSHAIDQGRVAGLHFEVAVLTNLTRDHLDYHTTMAEYAKTKSRLFLESDIKRAVINADDSLGQELITKLEGKLPVIAYSTGYNKSLCKATTQVFVKSVNYTLTSIHALIDVEGGEMNLDLPFVGKFNLENALAAFCSLLSVGVSPQEAVTVLSRTAAVPGRMQVFQADGMPVVVVDFAHTPEALRNVLTALRSCTEGRLYCVFGCGGGRDRGKRPIMARVADELADQIVITDDNVRFEDPDAIFQDIQAGFGSSSRFMKEHDRVRAITRAITLANEGDVVLIAGKGHETTQQVGAEKRPFSDAEIVKSCLRKK